MRNKVTITFTFKWKQASVFLDPECEAPQIYEGCAIDVAF